MSVIECNGVGIRYKTGNFKGIGLKEFVVKKATGRYEMKEFWADRDITFSLEKGDMLGIIGTNGAGKTTLLKAITGIMIPKEGTVSAQGDIAAFLELATGFDPEMNIRENTYLRGAMLGYTRSFMLERYDSILEFAELTDYQEYTFKQLSAGMKSRLAFAIAAQVDPDILILDEVLSVGDGAFRKKSGDKMREILSTGVTGILVSHSMSQVRELCNKILWLDHGRQIAFSNEVELYCDAYETFLRDKELPGWDTIEGTHSVSGEKATPPPQETVRAAVERMAAKQRAYRQEQQDAEHIAQVRALAELGGDLAVDAAIEILQKNRPEALDAQYIQEHQ